jgi:uncharacterized surface protein with fasciclin (FAS1) repeats
MKNITETAINNKTFSTLVTALTAADLVDTLSGPGPFTVLAPTNEAFEKIPTKDLEALLSNKAKLTKVLTYHVIAGKVMSTDIVKMREAKTLEGSMVSIDTKNGVMINSSKVITADIECTNGIIHVIDTVLMPN